MTFDLNILSFCSPEGLEQDSAAASSCTSLRGRSAAGRKHRFDLAARTLLARAGENIKHTLTSRRRRPANHLSRLFPSSRAVPLGPGPPQPGPAGRGGAAAAGPGRAVRLQPGRGAGDGPGRGNHGGHVRPGPGQRHRHSGNVDPGGTGLANMGVCDFLLQPMSCPPPPPPHPPELTHARRTSRTLAADWLLPGIH